MAWLYYTLDGPLVYGQKSDFLCPRPIGGNFGIARSVLLSFPWRSCLGYRHTGCLQLSHHQPPDMCGLRTRPRDFWIELPSAGAYRNRLTATGQLVILAIFQVVTNPSNTIHTLYLLKYCQWSCIIAVQWRSSIFVNEIIHSLFCNMAGYLGKYIGWQGRNFNAIWLSPPFCG